MAGGNDGGTGGGTDGKFGGAFGTGEPAFPDAGSTPPAVAAGARSVLLQVGHRTSFPWSRSGTESVV